MENPGRSITGSATRYNEQADSEGSHGGRGDLQTMAKQWLPLDTEITTYYAMRCGEDIR